MKWVSLTIRLILSAFAVVFMAAGRYDAAACYLCLVIILRQSEDD